VKKKNERRKRRESTNKRGVHNLRIHHLLVAGSEGLDHRVCLEEHTGLLHSGGEAVAHGTRKDRRRVGGEPGIPRSATAEEAEECVVHSHSTRGEEETARVHGSGRREGYSRVEGHVGLRSPRTVGNGASGTANGMGHGLPLPAGSTHFQPQSQTSRHVGRRSLHLVCTSHALP
jgi:hypothetical protein